MNKTFTLLALLLFTYCAKAQTPAPVAGAEAYGKIDKADLEMTACDFEKGANAEILFNKENIFVGYVVRHTRIKIFNEHGKNFANVSIPYFGGTNREYVINIEAETFNLVNGAVQVTKLDDKQIFKQKVDNWRSKIVFALPDVKAGSVIEFRYELHSFINYFPKWYYQDVIPERYNELNVVQTDLEMFPQPHVTQPFVKNGDVYNIDGKSQRFAQTAMANIPSLPIEPYMTSIYDNLQSMWYNVTGVATIAVNMTWKKLVKNMADNPNFGGQISTKLLNEDSVVNKAKKLSTLDDKVAFVFNTVKNDMKWNGVDALVTDDGTYTAWKNRSGNATEINLVLCRLLKRSGVNASPVLVSTREYGKANPSYPFAGQFNRAVVYVPSAADTSIFYALDASNKYNSYNLVPATLLNSIGFCMDLDGQTGKFIGLEDDDPVRKIVLVNAEITPDGKMTGTTDISDFGYNRSNTQQLYKTLDEKKFIGKLTNDNTNIDITDLKLENMDVDSLPLSTSFSFKGELQGADQNYLYLSTNLFSSLYSNPFINEKRATDIDFGYRDNYSITCTYKIPAGYAVDAAPKSINTILPDGGITFKRLVIVQDGMINIRYSIDHKKSFYFKEDYADFHEFYKKMYEALNEQIVLKKT